MHGSLPLKSRAFWLRQMRQWHWISAAVCLIGMLVFAVTGITLNHAGRIEAKPQVTARSAQLPDNLLQAVKSAQHGARQPLPPPLRSWVEQRLDIAVGNREAEWSQEIYLSLPRPGGDAWLAIDLDTGEARYERTDRGWIAYLNDLHKGRHTGIACVVFCVTGLVLLQLMADQRKSTWPLVAAGLVIPLIVAVFFIH
jgi:hypothetical protein